jgi:hypothetical protein
MVAASPDSALPSDTALVSWPGAVQVAAAADAGLPCMLAAALAAPGDVHQKSVCCSGVLQGSADSSRFSRQFLWLPDQPGMCHAADSHSCSSALEGLQLQHQISAPS